MQKFEKESFKTSSSNNSLEHWVIKKYSNESQETMQTLPDITTIDHKRKQFQMHAVARNVAQPLKIFVPIEFGVAFDYNRVYFAIFDSVTVEEYIEGMFQKYVNNTGEFMSPPKDELGTLYGKGQTLVYYSYFIFTRKFVPLDFQGAAYNLYDQEIATLELKSAADPERYFCTGNFSKMVFENLKKTTNVEYFVV